MVSCGKGIHGTAWKCDLLHVEVLDGDGVLLLSTALQDDVDHGNPLQLTASNAPKALVRRLAAGQPCIAINTSDKGVLVNPQWLTLQEADIVGKRLAEECTRMVEATELAQTTQSKL